MTTGHDAVHDEGLGLDPDDHDRAAAELGRFLATYESGLAERPLVPAVDRAALGSLLDPPPEVGVGVAGLFRDVEERVLPWSTAVSHPRFLAYVLGPPTGIGPYAEAVAARLNQNCNFWQLSPAASVIERSLLDWLAGLFGLGAAGGIFTGGGSMATLSALCAAVADRRPDFRERGLQGGSRPLVVYTSQEAHRSVDKAAALLGIGLDNVRHIPADDRFAMRPDLLAEAVHTDRAAGREPCCVVATAGTITTGAVDPLDEIADLCAAEDLWLHVDGAYGALFALVPEVRARFAACSRADSVTLDPHKLLFAPLEAGCLLVRDAEKLRRAHAFSSSYLTVADDPLMRDFMDFGPQLSRDFKAFKVWAALRTFGVERFRTALRRTLALAAYLGERVEAEPGLELMTPVTLTAVCLRLVDATDARHTEVLHQLAADGTALLGPASLSGRTAVRACVTNHRTSRDDIDVVVDRLAQLARADQ